MNDLPNWKQMTIDQKAEAVTPLLKDGLTASQIAAHFSDITRNSIIGFCHRYGFKLMGKPGHPRKRPEPAEPKPTRKRDKHATKANFIADRARKARAALPEIDATAFEMEPVPEDEHGNDVGHLIGIMDLTSVTCRWFFGDPKKVEKGNCGKPTENGGAYCPEHAARVYLRAKP